MVYWFLCNSHHSCHAIPHDTWPNTVVRLQCCAYIRCSSCSLSSLMFHGLFVCVLDILLSPAYMAEPIEMLLGKPRIRWDPDPPMGKGTFQGSYLGIPRHIDILRVMCKEAAVMLPLATSTVATVLVSVFPPVTGYFLNLGLSAQN